MLKIFVGFVIFAALAMFVIMRGGNNLDMGGEKHGAEAVHAPDASASTSASATSSVASATASASK